MKWRGGRTSKHVVDRRMSAGKVVGGGGAVAAVIVLTGLLVPGMEPLLSAIGLERPAGGGRIEQPIKDDTNRFVSVTLGFTEDVWTEVFGAGAFPSTNRYKPTVVVLFSGATESPCGLAATENGPFYCPEDQHIYIDPNFYKIMAKQLNSPGDFAQAYVIAHEVAHHVQNVAGYLPEIMERRLGMSRVEGNRLTVRLELQADCFAGVWANRTEAKHGVMEKGDLEEALRAAHQVGDDVLQRMSGVPVDPNAFTHGSSGQRTRWFLSGFESGDVGSCDTFSPPYSSL